MVRTRLVLSTFIAPQNVRKIKALNELAGDLSQHIGIPVRWEQNIELSKNNPNGKLMELFWPSCGMSDSTMKIIVAADLDISLMA